MQILLQAKVLVQMLANGKLQNIVNGTQQKKCDKNALAPVKMILKIKTDCVIPKVLYLIFNNFKKFINYMDKYILLFITGKLFY